LRGSYGSTMVHTAGSTEYLLAISTLVR
jgi:hypothetical protein